MKSCKSKNLGLGTPQQEWDNLVGWMDGNDEEVMILCDNQHHVASLFAIACTFSDSY